MTLARDEVSISLEHGALTIEGERSGKPDEQGTTYYVRERHYGAFRRTINLPAATQRSGVDASLEDGLLEITVVGAAAASEPKRIDIRGGGGEPR